MLCALENQYTPVDASLVQRAAGSDSVQESSTWPIGYIGHK
jgi:hypothetical protein